MKILWLMQITLLSLVLVLQPSHSISTEYRASIVVHYPLGDDSQLPASILSQNLAAYAEYASDAASEGAQIILFPEYTLGGIFGLDSGTREGMLPYCEELTMDIVACNKSSLSQQSSLSCISLQNHIVLVADLCELVPCDDSDPHCPSDGHYQYNTQVVFDESGLLIAKYHKSHLFGETGVLDAPPKPYRPVTVVTSFGVTFGLLVCFDANFEQPALDMLNDGVNDILFSSWWVNTPPIGTANLLQQAWSYMHNVNMLAANTGQCPTSCGSGVFSQGDALVNWFNSSLDHQRGILTTDVPVLASSIQPSAQPFLSTMNQPSPAVAFSEPCIGPSNTLGNCVMLSAKNTGFQSVTVQNGSLSCSFTYAMEHGNTDNDTWVLFAFDGNITYPASAPLPTRTCVLFSCHPISFDPLTCDSTRWHTTTSTFVQAELEGSFHENENVLPMLAVGTGEIVQSLKKVITISRGNDTRLSMGVNTEALPKNLWSLQLTSYVTI